MKTRPKIVAACLPLVVMVACSREPVVWSDVHYSLAGTAGAPSAAAVDVATADDSSSVPLALPDSARCRSSVRLARLGKSFFAAWWSARRDSSATLLASRSDDGGPWTKPVVVDSSDAGTRGCNRPAPSLAGDIASGYVHLAYFLEPASGAGVFFAHTMDRGATFHAPVPLVFGARPAATSVAAEGDRIAVAYEDPNSGRPQIFIALSKSMGHLFETKLPVSGENGEAENPVVRLRGTKLEVSWTERAASDSARERHASRTGAWR